MKILAAFLSLIVAVYGWNSKWASTLRQRSSTLAMTNANQKLSNQFNSATRHIKNVLGGCLLSFSVCSSALADAIPLVGSPAPDFTLPSSLGKDISLSDLKGKRTVLYFYPVRNSTIK
jgi:cytochrome oxidase Cu insertion factor (SCO1/SenC/PrrC family)